MVKRTVIFKELFEEHAHNITNYIKNNSEQNSENFKKHLLLKIEAIKQNPKLFPPERDLYTKRKLYRFSLLMKYPEEKNIHTNQNDYFPDIPCDL